MFPCNELYINPFTIDEIKHLNEPNSIEEVIQFDNLQLLLQCSLNPEFHDKVSTYLNCAAKYGALECFKFLIENDAVIWAETLMCAILGGNKEIINMCLHKIEPSQWTVTYAAIVHQNDIVHYFHEKYGLGIWWTSILPTSNYSLFFDRLFMEEDLNSVDENSDNALLAASLDGQFELIKLLIENGCDPDNKNSVKASPLVCSIINNRNDIVKYLLEKGVNIDAFGEGDVSPLTIACINGSIEIIKTLIEFHADINIINRNGETPLTIDELEREVAEILLDNGANIDKQNASGQTPLIKAVIRESENLIDLFLNRNPNTEIKDESRKSALDYANEIGNERIIDMLKSHSK